MPHDNVRILKEIDEAQSRNDIEGFLGYFADDIKVHTRGNHKLAGDYQGKEQFMDLFSRYMEAAGENYSFENVGYFADDEHGLTVQTSHYGRGNQKLDTQEALFCRFSDGKVVEMWFVPSDAPAFDSWVGL